MSLVEHLEELRTRLMWVIASVALAAIGGWIVFDWVVEVLRRPALPYLQDGPAGGNLIFTGPLEAFTTRLKVAVYIGFAISFPIVLYHFWRFIAPGLHRNEKRYAVPFVLSGMILFTLGVGFAFYTLPQAMQFLIGPAISGEFIRPLLTAKQYLDFALLYLAAFGIAFEFPLVLMFLTLTRVVSSRRLGQYRRHVFVGISVVVAFVTPSVDWYTMVVLTVVMYAMYEGSILLSRLLRR